jgi:YVTN family beta-propeller protein
MMNMFRAIRYLAPILALPLLLFLNCGDDEVEVQPTTTPHNFRKPDALTIVSDPENGEKEFLFIANSTKGTISIVDLTDNSLVDADGDSSNGTNPISINGITPAPDSRIIRDIATIPDGTLLLAAWVGPTAGFLSAIDIRGVFTGSGAGPQTTISLSGQPHSIAVSSGTAFITCSEPNGISSVICEGNPAVTCRENEMIPPIPNSPRSITISENSGFAYVTFFDSSKIATVNIAGPLTLVEEASLLSVSAGTISGTPIDLAIDPDTEEAYVTIASPTPYQLAVLDISSPTQGQLLGTTYSFAGLPRRVEVTPQPINVNGTTNRLVYVTNLTGQLHLIDDGVVSTISVGTLPGGIAISADGEKAYIANTGSDSISVVDSIKFEVIDTIR